MSLVHVIGGGLAGLTAALDLAEAGRRVVVHEASGQLGGRCRSFFDERIGCTIDNGAHVLVGANTSALDVLRRTGAIDRLVTLDALPFAEPAAGLAWTLPLADGLAGLALRREAAVPGVSRREWLAVIRLMLAGRQRTVAALIAPRSALFRRLIEPLTLAILNTPADRASAFLLGRTLRLALLQGRQAARVLIARRGLGDSFIEPLAARLAALGVVLRHWRRLRGFECEDDRARALAFADETVRLGNSDGVVLAVPAQAASDLLPGLDAPQETSTILNLHFRLPGEARLRAGGPVLGLIGTKAQWLFVRNEVATVTVSAAGPLADMPSERLADLLWNEVRDRLVDRPDAPPAWRCIKERRATFLQTPEAHALRPGPGTCLKNVVVAGDWTATGLPATIEGSVRSGRVAAALITRQDCAARTGTLSWRTVVQNRSF